MKKVFILLIAVLTVAMFCTPMAARKESNEVLLHDADTKFGNFTLDSKETTEGSYSLSVTLNGDSFVAENILRDEVDITDCDTVAIDMYISDVDKLAGINTIYFEVSSAGKCDEDELQWEFSGQLRDTKIEDGWNTVYLDLGTATQANEFDQTAVNYIRFYTFFGSEASGLTLKLDNIRACYTGGEDFSDMELDAYQGDNPDKDIVIAGQQVPDPTNRDQEMTKTAGFKK
ncbi:MAG: hypothetical protein IJW40_03005 [Clostridia bacterium]|nr:hypothetical protein [Clostridia bacterium]